MEEDAPALLAPPHVAHENPMARTHRPLVARNLPRTVSGLIPFARHVASSMKDKAELPSPPVSIATFEAHIDALETSQSATLTRTKGSAAARDLDCAQVTQDLRHLGAYVQQVADADPSRAEAIIESSGFHVKKVGARSKNELAVTQGDVSGAAHLVAKAPVRRGSYDWQYSTDGETWTNAPSTLGATTDITGLTPGKRYAFRFRSLTKSGLTDWSQIAWLLVK